MKEIFRVIEEAEKIFHSEIDWKAKYELIFSMKIASKIRDYGLFFGWYDPDTSYQEDVTAYMQALMQFKDDYKAVI